MCCGQSKTFLLMLGQKLPNASPAKRNPADQGRGFLPLLSASATVRVPLHISALTHGSLTARRNWHDDFVFQFAHRAARAEDDKRILKGVR